MSAVVEQVKMAVVRLDEKVADVMKRVASAAGEMTPMVKVLCLWAVMYICCSREVSQKAYKSTAPPFSFGDRQDERHCLHSLGSLRTCLQPVSCRALPFPREIEEKTVGSPWEV